MDASEKRNERPSLGKRKHRALWTTGMSLRRWAMVVVAIVAVAVFASFLSLGGQRGQRVKAPMIPSDAPAEPQGMAIPERVEGGGFPAPEFPAPGFQSAPTRAPTTADKDGFDEKGVK